MSPGRLFSWSCHLCRSAPPPQLPLADNGCCSPALRCALANELLRLGTGKLAEELLRWHARRLQLRSAGVSMLKDACATARTVLGVMRAESLNIICYESGDEEVQQQRQRRRSPPHQEQQEDEQPATPAPALRLRASIRNLGAVLSAIKAARALVPLLSGAVAGQRYTELLSTANALVELLLEGEARSQRGAPGGLRSIYSLTRGYAAPEQADKADVPTC